MRILILLLFLFFATFSLAQTSEVLFNKAESEFFSGKYEAASSLYSQVITADSENVNAYLRRGFCNSVQKNYEQAIADFSYVIEAHDSHLFAYISRGSAFNKTEDYQSALIDFDKALLLDPENQEAYNNRGWAKTGLGLAKEACEDWKQSKKLGNEEAKLILKNNHCK
ncbi:MAG: tetratricopeptide (TPR) repeat protein [Bacteroidia bacterium]|jgi:tetratricopeptide (TPR) repeat protein